MSQTVTSTAAPAREAAEPARRLGDLVSRYALLGVFVLVVAVFSMLRPQTYPTWQNATSILGNQAITLLLALAVLVPLLVGEFDLSVAATFGFCQLLVVGLLVRSGLGVVPAVLVAVGVGGLVGVFNAILITRFGVSSFIATLGTQTLLGGVALAYSGGQVVQGDLPAAFLDAGQGAVGKVSLVTIYALAVAVLLWFVLARTALGRRLLATGGNRDAARLSGVRTHRMVVFAFVTCGCLAAATGVAMAAELGSGQPLVGPSYLLPAYAGAFLGATTVTPGRFNVWGTVIAVYVLAAGVTGLQQLGVASWVEYVFNGAALLLSVILSGYAARIRAWRRARSNDRKETR
ncbi:ABC transporter permease [Pseudonocardia acaciae]|uniref:ABC transporter permease n=1 Tax=Pseudonocardia acaciae TaxID=551276 RepID=UPI00048B5352|nr:ABC transporter permease [Pseudonocardia acaciae]